MLCSKTSKESATDLLRKLSIESLLDQIVDSDSQASRNSPEKKEWYHIELLCHCILKDMRNLKVRLISTESKIDKLIEVKRQELKRVIQRSNSSLGSTLSDSAYELPSSNTRPTLINIEDNAENRQAHVGFSPTASEVASLKSPYTLCPSPKTSFKQRRKSQHSFGKTNKATS